MKITILVDDYLPSSTKVAAKMLHELAQAFLAEGHEVSVVTPNSDLSASVKVSSVDGVEVVQFRAGNVKSPNKIIRAINELLMSFTAWRRLSGYFQKNHCDLVVYYSPSIFFSGLVQRLKKLWGCPSYLVLRDIFPGWAVDQGLIVSGSLIHRFFEYFERKNYDAADKIGLQSMKNLELFNQRFSSRYNTECLYNWASTNIDKPQTSGLREKYSLQDKVIYFYGGNMGSAQDMMNLVRLAKSMESESNAHFVFVGSGDEYHLVERAAKESSNILVLPSVGQAAFLSLLSASDVGLFSLSSKHTAHNFPGKLLSYVQLSKPILGSVNVGNDIVDVFDRAKAGLIHVNGEDEQFYHSARQLMDEKVRSDLSVSAIKLLENEFSIESAARKISS